MYELLAIKESGGLLEGHVDGMKLGYYSGKFVGGPRDGGSRACCIPDGGDGYIHNGYEWVWLEDYLTHRAPARST